MSSRNERLASIIIGIAIITYGILSTHLVPYYQSLVERIISIELLDQLKTYFSGRRFSKEDQFNLGKYFIYYPSYLILHIGLIAILFRKAPRSRKIGFIAIGVGIPFLAFLSLFFFQIGWMAFYNATIGMFTTFVGYPFILFVVEGGKLIDKNIDKLIEDRKQS